ncbi:MAG: tRNA lysidine(34) synthetase TilS [Verrucomicrobiota bacterium]
MAASKSPSRSKDTSARKRSANPGDSSAAATLERVGAAALQSIAAGHPKLSLKQTHLIGLSGGRDSVALLHFLVNQGYRKLIICHLNHGLRGRESGQDAAFVQRLAKRYHLPCETLKMDIGKRARETRTSLETAAREERLSFFAAAAKKHRCRSVFLAHHADDDAETVLHNLFRGTGLQGVSGMKPVHETAHGLLLVRPLLDATRQDINDYITAHKLAFREDSSNQSPEHTRNRVRHELMPLLGGLFQRDVVPLLKRFSSLAARDHAFISGLSEAFAIQHTLFNEDGSLRLRAEFKKAHPAIQSRILQCWLTEVHQVPKIGQREIEAAISMLEPEGPARINLPGDRHLRRKAGRLMVFKPAP